MTEWEKAQDFESRWHQTIGANTYNEETKQFIYASKMGIEKYATPETPHNFKNYGKILDIGGGEVSMLLKMKSPYGCTVVDPCNYPQWVYERYAEYGVRFEKIKGEDFLEYGYDEVWIYNCLQHTEDPEKICHNSLENGKIVRVFEWVDTGIGAGHIHNLTEENLNKWLGGEGKVEILKDGLCAGGKCYYGIFKGKL